MAESLDFSIAEKYFRISLNQAQDALLSVPAAELLKPDVMDEVLHCSAKALKAFALDLPASFVGLSLFGLSASVQYFLSKYNRFIDLRLDNMVFQIEPYGNLALGSFWVKELRMREVPAEDRQTFIIHELTHFYRETLNPILQLTAARAGVKPDLIWNQYGARMTFARDLFLANEPSEEVRNRFLQDLDLLVHGLSPALFHRKKNPFAHKPRYTENPWQKGELTVIRSSCCLYYRREGGEKCYNCPLLTDQEREAKKNEMLQKNSS